jgi:serine protease Do
MRIRHKKAMLPAGLAVLLFATAASALNSEGLAMDELIRVESTVRERLPVAKDALVAVEMNGGAASGVIISADGLVLTAAHVTAEPGRRIHVKLSNGKRHPCKALGLDKSTDAAMMRLEGNRKDWPHVPLCKDLRVVTEGSWCFALGHPGGHDAQRGPVLRVGKIVKNSANMLQSDCVLMGGDSGGPLFNLSGEVIGIHSQIWTGRDQNMHVSLAPFLRSWEAMRKSEVIRRWAVGNGAWLGLATRIGKDGALEVHQVAEGSPAQQTGIVAGEVIVALDGRPMLDPPQFSEAIRERKAGDLISLRVRGGKGERVLEVKLAQRPEEKE